MRGRKGHLALSVASDIYISMVYPDGIVPEQYEQLKDAFIAGAYLVLDAMTNEMGEEETIALCRGWIEEAKSHAKRRNRDGHG